MLQAMHTSTNFGENIYKDIVLTRFFESLPAVTLTFDPKS